MPVYPGAFRIADQPDTIRPSISNSAFDSTVSRCCRMRAIWVAKS